MRYNSIEVMGYSMLSGTKHLGFAHDKNELKELVTKAHEQGFSYVELMWIDLEGKGNSTISTLDMTDILNRIPRAFE